MSCISDRQWTGGKLNQIFCVRAIKSGWWERHQGKQEKGERKKKKGKTLEFQLLSFQENGTTMEGRRKKTLLGRDEERNFFFPLSFFSASKLESLLCPGRFHFFLYLKGFLLFLFGKKYVQYQNGQSFSSPSRGEIEKQHKGFQKTKKHKARKMQILFSVLTNEFQQHTTSAAHSLFLILC